MGSYSLRVIVLPNAAYLNIGLVVKDDRTSCAQRVGYTVW